MELRGWGRRTGGGAGTRWGQGGAGRHTFSSFPIQLQQQLYAMQNKTVKSCLEINRTHLSKGFFNFISQLQLQLLQSESSQRLDEKTIVIMHINT